MHTDKHKHKHTHVIEQCLCAADVVVVKSVACMSNLNPTPKHEDTEMDLCFRESALALNSRSHHYYLLLFLLHVVFSPTYVRKTSHVLLFSIHQKIVPQSTPSATHSTHTHSPSGKLAKGQTIVAF